MDASTDATVGVSQPQATLLTTAYQSGQLLKDVRNVLARPSTLIHHNASDEIRALLHDLDDTGGEFSARSDIHSAITEIRKGNFDAAKRCLGLLKVDEEVLFLSLYVRHAKGVEPLDMYQVEDALAQFPKSVDLLFMKALTSRLCGLHELMENLLQCLRADPLHVAAWMELESIIFCKAQISHIGSCLPKTWLGELCLARSWVRIAQSVKGDSPYSLILNQALELFPNHRSLKVLSVIALCCRQDHDQALALSAELERRVSTIDSEHACRLSDYLFVSGQRASLALLAKRQLEHDKGFQLPQTSYILGQLYAFNAFHERACKAYGIAHKLFSSPFQRASCRILMGHAQVEAFKPTQAMRTYREALTESVGLDFRAWEGLCSASKIMGYGDNHEPTYRKKADLLQQSENWEEVKSSIALQGY